MMTRALVVVVVVLMGCPQMPSTDGGTGGGTGGGGGSNLGGGGGATGGGSGGVALADFCAAAQSARCAKDIRCGAAAQGADCQKLAIAFSGALSSARPDCLGPSLRANLSSGRTIYDGLKAKQCFDAASTSPTCASVFAGIVDDPSCNEIFRGTIAQGQTCYGFNECVPGQYCDASFNDVCPGTCRPRVSEGAAPSRSAECELGLIRKPQTDGGVLCVARTQPGQSCTLSTGFSSNMECAGANSCLATPDGGAACQPLRTAGQPCSSGALVSDCAVDHLCTAVGDGGRECVALARAGQPCSNGSSCQLGLACSNGTCGPLIAVGGSCGSDTDCVAGALCNAGTCEPFGTLDAGCHTLRGGCAVGLFCNSAGHCEPKLGLGADCSAGECDNGAELFCNATTDAGFLGPRACVSVCRAP